jgi:hypothetical protein
MISRIMFPALTTLCALAIFAGNPSRVFAADTDQRQYYEVRTYTTVSDQQRQRVNDY